MSFEVAALILAWGAIAVLAFAMAGLLQQVRMLTTLIAGGAGTSEGPAVGQSLPEGVDLGSGAGTERIFVFMDRDCPGCASLAPKIAQLADERDLDFALVFPDSGNGLRSGSATTLEGKSAAFKLLQIPATPFALRVDSEGLISDAAPLGSTEALHEFVAAGHEEMPG